MKTSIFDIEEKGRRAIDRNPWQKDINGEQQDAENAAHTGKATTDIGRMQHVMGTIAIDGRHRIKIRFLGSGAGHGKTIAL